MEIDESFVQVGVVATDWSEAVRKSGEILLQKNIIEPRYIDAMIHTIQSFGPYMVIAPLVVMPHARPTDGVLQQGVCFTLLKEPVLFGNEPNENNRVKLVIALAATDSLSHIELLRQISEVIQDDMIRESLLNATSTQELVSRINNASQN